MSSARPPGRPSSKGVETPLLIPNAGKFGISPLPAPLCAPDVDCRDLPIPREAFAQMAVLQFGISIEEARAHANRVADDMEGRPRARRRRA